MSEHYQNVVHFMPRFTWKLEHRGGNLPQLRFNRINPLAVWIWNYKIHTGNRQLQMAKKWLKNCVSKHTSEATAVHNLSTWMRGSSKKKTGPFPTTTSTIICTWPKKDTIEPSSPSTNYFPSSCQSSNQTQFGPKQKDRLTESTKNNRFI